MHTAIGIITLIFIVAIIASTTSPIKEKSKPSLLFEYTNVRDILYYDALHITHEKHEDFQDRIEDFFATYEHEIKQCKEDYAHIKMIANKELKKSEKQNFLPSNYL